MSLKKFLEEHSPEALEKMAEEAQDDFLAKLIPILEKTSEYTAKLVIEKMATENVIEKKEKSETLENNTETIENTNEATASNKTNEDVDPTTNPGGLKAQDVKDAVAEAIRLNHSDKIMPFVKALVQKYPELLDEIVKMIKVELHDGVMKKYIDESSALNISNELNSLSLGETND